MKRSLILIGMTGLLGQVLMLRELAVSLRGNELVFGMTLASWLALTALGSGLLGRWADRLPGPRTLYVLGLAATGTLTPVGIVGLRLIGELLFGPTELIAPLGRALLATTALLAPLGLTLGFLFAVACRLFASGERSAQWVSRIYVYDAAGTVLGGLMFTYGLAGRVSNLHIAIGLAALDCFAAFALWLHGEDRKPWGWALAVVAFLWVAALVTPVASVVNLATQRARYPGETLRWSRDSRYGHVDVTTLEEQRNFYYDRVSIGSTHNEAAVEPVTYLPLLAHERPTSVLMIGGAGTGALRKLLEDPAVTVDMVELDPAVLRAAKKFAGPEDRAALEGAERARTITDMDGRRWIKQCRDRYDVILCCLPDPSTMVLNRYYTVEFFREARRALKAGGLLATQLTGSPSQMTRALKHLTLTHLQSLGRVFPHVALAPLDYANVFLASGRPFASDGATFARRLPERGYEPVFLVPGVLSDVLRDDRRSRVLDQLHDVSGVRLNRDLWPVSTVFALLHWGGVEGGGWATVLQRAMGIRLLHFVLIAVAAAAALLGVAMFHRRPVAVIAPATIAAGGWAALVLEVAIIYVFQGLYGYAYAQLGMLIAAFMVGLAGGALTSGRRLSTARALPRLVLARLLGALLAAAMPLVFRYLARGWFGVAGEYAGLASLNLAVGFLTGYSFPPGLTVAITDGSRVARQGGMIYGLDLAGSCLGALAAGAFFIPVVGLTNTCYIVAGVLMLCAGCLLVGMGTEAPRDPDRRKEGPPKRFLAPKGQTDRQ